MIKKTSLFLVFIIFSMAVVSAQYNPVAGSEDVEMLFSPDLSSNPSVLGGYQSSLAAPSMQPAAFPNMRTSIMGLSYFGITGFGDTTQGQGLQGHRINALFLSPLGPGSFTSGLAFETSELTDMSFGTHFLGYANYARTLGSGFSVGAQVNFELGQNDTFDFGLGLGLGLQHEAKLADGLLFGWGISILRMGKGFSPTSGQSSLLSPFTLGGGIQFVLGNPDDFSLALGTDISTPAFQSIRVKSGVTAEIAKVGELSVGWSLDTAQQTDSSISAKSLIPSFGFSIDLGSLIAEEKDSSETQTIIDSKAYEEGVRVSLSGIPLYGSDMGFGLGVTFPVIPLDQEPPDVTLVDPGKVYLSPNSDGIQDTLEVPFTVEDVNTIASFTLILENDEGEILYERVFKADEEAVENFETSLSYLFEERPNPELPENLSINGRNLQDEILPDGEYRMIIASSDKLGNSRRDEINTIVFDTMAPTLEIKELNLEELAFSPNDDGNKDEILIPQSGSFEQSWSAQILDVNGSIIRDFNFSNEALEELFWDGKDNNGNRVPDGVYEYSVTSTDEAGNQTIGGISNILVNSIVSPVRVGIDYNFLSPNSDGRFDTITLTPKPSSTSGISQWFLMVENESGEIVRTISGTGTSPSTYAYDGLDDDGNVLSEGTYKVLFETIYRSGNQPKAYSPEFVVDLTAPSALVQVEQGIFSPNGDGNLDELVLYQETSNENTWSANIADEAGEIIQQYQWRNQADLRLLWDGKTLEGSLAENGDYTYIIFAEDEAGNRGESRPVRFTLDNSASDILISTDLSAFSPNADGSKDRIRILPQVSSESPQSSYRLRIESINGTVFKTFSGTGTVPEEFIWDGKDEQGQIVDDGRYRVKFNSRFVNGNSAEAQTAFFTLDTQYPIISVSANYSVFSPNGDDNKDEVTVRQTSNMQNLFEGEIKKDSGELIRSFVWNGALEAFQWDGTDDFGNPADDGFYKYTVWTVDAAGNRTEDSTEFIEIDTRNTSVFVTASAKGISPNGDGFKDTIEFGLFVNLIDGATGWNLEVMNSNNETIKTFSGSNVQSQFSVQWDGLSDEGDVIEGSFFSRFQVDYRKGDQPNNVSGVFQVDVSPATLAVGLNPLPFGPDNDGVADILDINLSVSDRSPIAGWKLSIFDRTGNLFHEFAGQGAPVNTLQWDGLNPAGERVIAAEDYPYVFTVLDELGNVSEKEGQIPIDILVIRIGDIYKVQIANITFEPNSPRLVLDPEDPRGIKNGAIIERLAEVFDKYPSYRITIEGHAVNISGTEREETQELVPLSESRAQTVKDALVAAGMNPSRIDILGMGGRAPLVPHTDQENRWKNRRVEFILIR